MYTQSNPIVLRWDDMNFFRSLIGSFEFESKPWKYISIKALHKKILPFLWFSSAWGINRFSQLLAGYLGEQQKIVYSICISKWTAYVAILSRPKKNKIIYTKKSKKFSMYTSKLQWIYRNPKGQLWTQIMTYSNSLKNTAKLDFGGHNIEVFSLAS